MYLEIFVVKTFSWFVQTTKIKNKIYLTTNNNVYKQFLLSIEKVSKRDTSSKCLPQHTWPVRGVSRFSVLRVLSVFSLHYNLVSFPVTGSRNKAIMYNWFTVKWFSWVALNHKNILHQIFPCKNFITRIFPDIWYVYICAQKSVITVICLSCWQ